MHSTREPSELERVLLVRAYIGNESEEAGSTQEMTALIQSAGGSVVARESQKRKTPDPRLFIGKGKADELREVALRENTNTIVFDHNLSSGQVSRLEEATNCKVIDRTELILAIFAEQARTREAKLQIELAQLLMGRRIFPGIVQDQLDHSLKTDHVVGLLFMQMPGLDYSRVGRGHVDLTFTDFGIHHRLGAGYGFVEPGSAFIEFDLGVGVL